MSEAKFLVFVSGRDLSEGYYFAHDEKEVAQRVEELSETFPNQGVTVMCTCNYNISATRSYHSGEVGIKKDGSVCIEPILTEWYKTLCIKSIKN